MSYDETIILPDGTERTKEEIYNELVDAALEQDLKVSLNDETIAVTIDDFYEGSQNQLITDRIAEVIFQLEDFLNDLDKSSRLTLSEEEALWEKGEEKGIYLLEGEKATGEATFILPIAANSDTEIPSDTLISTDTIVSYKTLENLIIPTGILSGVVPIECTKEGTEGNLPARSITTILTDLPVTVSVTNENPITGGIDPESDESFKQRVIDNTSPPGSKGWYEAILNSKFEDSLVFIDLEETVNCWFKPYDFQENPLEIAENLFETDELITTDKIIINEPQPIEAFNSGTRKLFIKYQPDGSVPTKDIEDEIIKRLKDYVSKRKMKDGIITMPCIQFMVETTEGVQYFDMNGSSYKGYSNGEQVLNRGEYFIFGNANTISFEVV